MLHVDEVYLTQKLSYLFNMLHVDEVYLCGCMTKKLKVTSCRTWYLFRSQVAQPAINYSTSFLIT